MFDNIIFFIMNFTFYINKRNSIKTNSYLENHCIFYFFCFSPNKLGFENLEI